MTKVTADVLVIFAPAGDEPRWRIGLAGGGVNGRGDAGAPQVMDLAAPPDATASDVVERAKGAAIAAGWSGRSVVLALGSSDCLAGTVPLEGLRRRTGEALLYRLEPQLPLAAEDVSADFLYPVGNAQAFGVCAGRRRAAPVVEAIERAGLPLDAVAPAPLLALQGYLEDSGVGGGDKPPDLVIWGDGNQGLDAFCLSGDRPTAWAYLPADPTAARRWLTLQILRRGPLRLSLLNVPPAVAEQLDAGGTSPVEGITIDQTTAEAATAAAALLQRVGRRPWIDVRRGGGLGAADPIRPVRRPLVACAAALAGLVLTFSLACLYRAQRYDALTQGYRDAQREAFRRALPTQAVPPAGLRLRLAGEERRLRGLTGGADGEGASGGGPSALALLYEAMRRLPTDLRYRVLEFRLDDRRRLYLEGQVRAHGDAETLATALRARQGFRVDPPRTEQTDPQTVDFILAGTWPPDPAETLEGRR